MNSRDHTVSSISSRAIPEKSTYMMGHIGGIKYDDKLKELENDTSPDRDPQYTKDQNRLINERNDSLYKRDQHDESLDLPISGYNHVQSVNPLGYNMINTHGDKGFDYRDFPKELMKDRMNYDPYIGYLHKNGLIGKNKNLYNIDYINIDSSFREKNASSKTKFTIQLDNNPLEFNGLFLRIYVNDTSLFSLNDKINLSGIMEKELTLRSIVTDDFGNKINYFLMQETQQFMTITADTNININSGFTTEVKEDYTDMVVQFTGFKGDIKTEWYFDTRGFIWEFIPIIVNDQDAYIFRLTEDVLGVSESTANNPENTQVKLNMLIAEFKVDRFGTVFEITGGIPYRADDIRWTEPASMAGSGTPPVGIPEPYYTDSSTQLLLLGLSTLPTVPTTFYKVMDYFNKVQNAIRPIFLNKMSQVINFNLRYQEKNKTYRDVVRIVVPEQTKITNTSFVGNISLNLLNGYHRMFLTSADVERDLGIYDPETSISNDNLAIDKFYISLNKPYTKRDFSFTNPLLTGALLVTVYEEPISDITIKYLHYGGVPIKNINAEFPIGFKSVEGFKYVRDIVENSYIVVELDRVGLLDNKFGGDCIYLGLIENITNGYPNPNSYVVNLEKVYTNVVLIRMVNSIFPVTQKVLMDGLSGGRRNNRFYWQNLDDGDTIYQIELEAGNYSTIEFKTLFENTVKNIPRNINVANNINSFDLDFGIQMNCITIDINENSDKVIFKSFNVFNPSDEIYLEKDKLSEINQLCGSVMMNTNELPEQNLVDEEDIYYQYPTGDFFKNFPNMNIDCDAYRIKIKFDNTNNILKVGDMIVIENSLNFEDIPEKYLNGSHIVTRVDENSFDILISNVNLDNTLDMTIKGGFEIVLYTPNLFRIRFDFQDTFGTELGFRDVGQETSITNYLHVIDNDILYENEDQSSVLQTITGRKIDLQTSTTFNIRNTLQLTGPPYILITCKEIPKCKNFGTIKDYFYKIYLKKQSTNDNVTRNVDRNAYDTYVNAPIFFNDPINLNSLSLDFYAPDGSYYDFNGADHSFVLEIVTFNEIPEGTSIES